MMRAGLLLAAALLSPVAATAQKAAPDQASLAARLQRLEDIEEIRTVLLNYGRFLDARDFAAYSRLFAKDGEWVAGPLVEERSADARQGRPENQAS